MVDLVFDLFAELHATDAQMDFQVLCVLLYECTYCVICLRATRTALLVAYISQLWLNNMIAISWVWVWL